MKCHDKLLFESFDEEENIRGWVLREEEPICVRLQRPAVIPMGRFTSSFGLRMRNVRFRPFLIVSLPCLATIVTQAKSRLTGVLDLGSCLSRFKGVLGGSSVLRRCRVLFRTRSPDRKRAWRWRRMRKVCKRSGLLRCNKKLRCRQHGKPAARGRSLRISVGPS